MKQLIIQLAILMVITIGWSTAHAQNSLFKKGDANAQVGIGFISTLEDVNGDSPVGMTFPLTTPPVCIILEYGITDQFSIGGYFGKAKNNAYYHDIYGEHKLGTISHSVIGGRVAYHFEISSKFDTYAGGMLGYDLVNVKGYDDSEASRSGLTYNILVGGRYYLTDNIGGFLEIGYGVAVVNLGITLKLL
jgi:hypothetical protein